MRASKERRGAIELRFPLTTQRDGSAASEFDEVVGSGLEVHGERMSERAYWISVRDPASGDEVHINMWTKRATLHARAEWQ